MPTLFEMLLQMESVNQVQDEAVCVSLCNNTFRKGMNPSILEWQTGLFYFGWETSLGKGIVGVQTSCAYHILSVGEGLGKYIYTTFYGNSCFHIALLLTASNFNIRLVTGMPRCLTICCWVSVYSLFLIQGNKVIAATWSLRSFSLP